MISLHSSGDFSCQLGWLGLVIKILDIQVAITCDEDVPLTQNLTVDAWEKGHLTLYIHRLPPREAEGGNCKKF